MSQAPSPEERAQALVNAVSKVPGGPWFVELPELVEPAVLIGPYENPSLAHEEAEKIRKYLAVLIREAGGQPRR